MNEILNQITDNYIIHFLCRESVIDGSSSQKDILLEFDDIPTGHEDTLYVQFKQTKVQFDYSKKMLMRLFSKFTNSKFTVNGKTIIPTLREQIPDLKTAIIEFTL